MIGSRPRGQMTTEARGGWGKPLISPPRPRQLSHPLQSEGIRTLCIVLPFRAAVFDSPTSSENTPGFAAIFTFLALCKLFPGPVLLLFWQIAHDFFFFFTVPALPNDWVADFLGGLFADSVSSVDMLTWWFSCSYELPQLSGSFLIMVRLPHVSIQNLLLMPDWLWILVNQAQRTPTCVFLLGLFAQIF